MTHPSPPGILAAARLIAPHATPAPLVRALLLSSRYECELFVKNETVSPVASFKWRGALTALLRNEEARRGVVTSSTGNHGQGVAWAASIAGVPAHIFLPESGNPLKRRKIELLGAVIHDSPGDLDAVKELAVRWAHDQRLPFIDDGESADVIEGAGTVGLEVAAALHDIDIVFVPMGSGSLASGVALAVKDRHPRTRVIAVQSAGAPSMVESFRAARAVELPAETVADGLICRVPARLALESLLAHVDEAVTVSDEAILAAAREMAESAQILVEPSGAAGLAAARAHRDLAGKRAVVIATGANVTGDVLRRIVAAEPY